MWQLLGSQSDVGFCLAIRLPIITAQRTRSPTTSVSEGCGNASPGTLNVTTSSGGNPPRNALVYGTDPDNAARIRVSSQHATVTVPTLDDKQGLPGRLYLGQLPVQIALQHTTVSALAADDTTIAKASVR